MEEDRIYYLTQHVKLLEETIHIILNNQKKIYFDVEKIKREEKLDNNQIKDLDSYNELTTTSLEQNVFRQERNEVRKSKNGKTVFIVTRILNEMVHVHTVYNENGKNIETEEFTNCKKEEFLKLWNKI